MPNSSQETTSGKIPQDQVLRRTWGTMDLRLSKWGNIGNAQESSSHDNRKTFQFVAAMGTINDSP